VDVIGGASLADEGETQGTSNKSGLEDDAMGLECDGQNCYPKFF
jgi:hypothetical protein